MKRYIWIPTMFTRFNTSGLLPLGDLEGCHVSQETGYAGGPSCRNQSSMCSNPHKHFDQGCSINCSPLY